MKLTIIIIILSILIVGSTAYVGIKYSDGVVTQDHYEKGLIFDKRKKLIDENELSLTITSISREEKKINVMYKLKSKIAIPQDQITVSVVRPGTVQSKYSVELKENENTLVASFIAEEKGYFMLRNDFRIDDTVINLEKNFYVN